MQKLPGYFKAILFIVAIYFGWHLLLLTRSILIPLIVAWLIAVVLLPLQLFLENKLHVPKGFAAFFCILVVLVFVGLFISFISGESSAFSADLTQLEQKFSGSTGSPLQNWLGNNSQLGGYVNKAMNAFISFFSSLMGTVVVSVVNIFIWLVLIVVFTFFFLYYRQILRQFLIKLLKEENSLRFEKSINAVKKLVKHFMTGILIEMLAVALLSGILLSIFGIQHSIMLALLAAVLNIIPYAGIYSATLLGVLISYGNTNSTAAVTTAIIFLFVHLVDANLLMPRIMESQVKLNSFAALVAVLSGGLIWGVPGMFLAIPLTAVARILFEQIPSCQPLALLLGNDNKNSSLIPPKKSEI